MVLRAMREPDASRCFCLRFHTGDVAIAATKRGPSPPLDSPRSSIPANQNSAFQNQSERAQRKPTPSYRVAGM